MERQTDTFPVLTITGSDSAGGSGVQADIKAITALGGYAVSAITSVTVQNTLGIQEFFDLPAGIIAGQMEAIFDDLRPRAVKIGMIRNVETVDAIAGILRRHAPSVVVCAPMVVSSRNEELMAPGVVRRIKEKLLQHCSLLILTPQAAGSFLPHPAATPEALLAAAGELRRFGCRAVLLTEYPAAAGTAHMLVTGDAGTPLAALACHAPLDGHGAGNTFSSAITTLLGRGCPLHEAVEEAQTFITRQAALAGRLEGRGSRLYHEFLQLIATCYATGGDVRFYADRLNVTARYLAQVTKRLAGMTPKALIDAHLLKQAEIRLGTTNRTVQEIAYELGFRSQAHFTKFFKKMKGGTPSGYRRTHE